MDECSEWYGDGSLWCKDSASMSCRGCWRVGGGGGSDSGGDDSTSRWAPTLDDITRPWCSKVWTATIRLPIAGDIASGASTELLDEDGP